MSKEIVKKEEDNLAMLDVAGNNLESFKGADVASFAVALQMGREIKSIRNLLSIPQNLKILRELEGSVIGFTTDRDSKDGSPSKNPYSDKEIVDAIIEARAMGLYPMFGHMEVLFGHAYCKAPGFRYRLKTVPGLESYSLVCSIPILKNGGAVSKVKVSWTLNGKEYKEELEWAIKVNAGQGADAINGKAERKSLRWLHCHLTQQDIPDGDMNDKPMKEAVEYKASEQDKKSAEAFDNWANGLITDQEEGK